MNNLNDTNYKANYKKNDNTKIIIGLVIGLIIGIIATVIYFLATYKFKEEERKGGGWLGVGDITTQKENTNSSSNNTGSNNGNGSQTGTQTSSEYDVSMFKEVDINGFMNLYNGSERSVIYIGRATCGYCVKFLPSLQKAQQEFGYQTYYYDIDKLTLDDFNQIVALNSFLEENFGATPMVLVVQNGQIVSPNNDGQGWLGYNEYEAFKEYLQSLGY